MQVIILGDLKYYESVRNAIHEATEVFLKTSYSNGWDFDLVFVWGEEEDEIYWDTFNDIIKISIPLSTGVFIDVDILSNKIKRAIDSRI